MRDSEQVSVGRAWRAAVLVLLPVVAGAIMAGCTPSKETRIGTFTPRLVNGSVRYSSQQIANEAAALGVRYERVHQVVGAPLNSQVPVLERRGIHAHLTIKASPKTATVPPRTKEELATFQRNFGALLDSYSTLLVAVENEELVDKFFTGTADEYLTELRAAADVANQHGVPITNGGIDRRPIALATWNHLRLTRGHRLRRPLHPDRL